MGAIRPIRLDPARDHGDVVAAGEAEVAPVLQSGEGFVVVLVRCVLESIPARGKALGAVEAEFGLEGGEGVAVADLVGLGRLALVEQEQRHRDLIAGIAELLGGRCP
jgi:hypothetical protein